MILSISDYLKLRCIEEGISGQHIEVVSLPVISPERSDMIKKNNDTPFFVTVINLAFEDKARAIIDYLPYISKVLNQFKNVKYYVIGGGKYEDDVRNQIRLIDNDNIEATGFVQDPDGFYKNSIFVLYLSYLDGSSNCILESFSFSKPVIANDYPPLTELVEDGVTGYIIDSPEMLMEKIAFLIENPDHALRLGSNARSKVLKKNTEKIIGNRLVEAFQRHWIINANKNLKIS